MKSEKHMQMLKMLQDCVIEKYVSNDEYEELVVRDQHGNKMFIKFYPNENEQNTLDQLVEQVVQWNHIDKDCTNERVSENEINELEEFEEKLKNQSFEVTLQNHKK